MNWDVDIVVDPELACEIAQREGAKAVVAGEVASIGTGYVVSARLLSAADGSSLVSLRENASDASEIILAVDRLSAKLRERIGESLKTIRGAESLAHVTTSSLEALRKYSEAWRIAERGEWEQSIRLLREAIAIDSGFAMAHRKLGVVLGNSFGSNAERVEALSKAFEYRDRLPMPERQFAAAYYYRYVERNPDQVVTAYRDVLKRYPNETTALNNLAVQLNDLRQYAEAEQLALRASMLGEGIVYYGNAIRAQVAQGKFAEADTTLARFKRHAPDNSVMWVDHASVASARGDYRLADAYLDSAVAASNSVSNRAAAHWMKAALARVEGRLADAERGMRQANELELQRGVRQAVVLNAVELAYGDLAARNEVEPAVERVEAVLMDYSLTEMAPLDRPYLELALFFAVVGEPARGQRLLGRWNAEVDAQLREIPLRLEVEGAIAVAEGRHDDGIAKLREFRARTRCEACGLVHLGRAFELAGSIDSAVAVYETFANAPRLDLIVQEAAYWVPTHRRLGELYEQRGDREKALQYYNQFVEVWAGADAELQPQVTEAQERIERLTAVGR